MKTYKIKMIKDCGHFKKDKIYDGAERTDGYVIMHHTGWYVVPKEAAQKIKVITEG